MKRKIISTFILIFISTTIFSQNNRIDSLENLLTKSIDDTARCSIYCELIEYYSNVNTEKASFLGEEILPVAEKSDNQIYLADVYYNLGLNAIQKSDYSLSYEYLYKALKIYDTENNEDKYFNTYIKIAENLSEEKDFTKAKEIYKELFQLAINNNDTLNIARVNLNLGIFYRIYGVFIYYHENDYEKAMKYIDTAYLYMKPENTVDIFLKEQNKKLLGSAYNNIGILNTIIMDYDQAISNYEKSKNLAYELQNYSAVSGCLINLGICYMKKEDYSTALQYYNKGIELADSVKNTLFKQNAYINMTDLYLEQNDYENAFNYLNLAYFLKDSIFQEAKLKYIAEYQTKYETEKKEQQIEIQNITISKQTQKIRFLVVGIIIFVLFVAIVLYLWLQKKTAFNILFKQNQQVVAKQKQLEKQKLFLENQLKEIPEPKNNNNQTEKTQTLWIEIQNLIEKQKIFLDTELTIEKLAQELGSNKTYVSNAIKENTDEHFNNFINQYRIDEARKILTDAENNIQIKNLHTEVGFKSKSTFYNSFKKITGFSPIEYRNRILTQKS